MSSQAVENFFRCGTYVRNYFGFEKYKCFTSFFGNGYPLNVSIGYFIVLGFGILFGVLTLGLVYVEQLRTGEVMKNSEVFNTAGRTVKTGLTASVIVSQWTWAAALLNSSNVAHQYGISGPLWYASGATVQVILFSMLAVLVKRRAPTSHTFLEIIRARWGKTAHIVFMVFALLTNVVVSAMLLLGGSAIVHALTGMNAYLACFLIPLGVILYTLAGGLKATFIASYFDSVIIFSALCLFLFQVYSTSSDLGSPGEVWRRLQQVAAIEPVEGNYRGSYLTILSRQGLFFGITNLVGNFGAVFLDQAYWQSAIAATPSASWKGYILGGLCWFAIPFCLATSLGLASVALSLPITKIESDKGLIPAAVGIHLLGKSGATLIFVMLFMAVTSTGAAEQIAVSSLVAYDIYRTYINPLATGAMIIKISRIVIFIFGILMGVFGIILIKIGISLGWMYKFMGVLIGSAVFPVAFSISWSKASSLGSILGTTLGSVFGVVSWLIYAAVDGGISVENLGREEIMLTGNLVSIFSSGAICVVLSLFKPDSCDWSCTRSIPLIEDDPHAVLPTETEADLKRAMKAISFWGYGLTGGLLILWPALAIPAKSFGIRYFYFWVILSFIWGLSATAIMILLPLWESKATLFDIAHCSAKWARSKFQSK